MTLLRKEVLLTCRYSSARRSSARTIGSICGYTTLSNMPVPGGVVLDDGTETLPRDAVFKRNAADPHSGVGGGKLPCSFPAHSATSCSAKV